jgi:hypothetical protein
MTRRTTKQRAAWRKLAWLCEHPNVFTYIVCNTNTTGTSKQIRLSMRRWQHANTDMEHSNKGSPDGGRGTCVPGIRASGWGCVCASLDDLRLGLTATVERGRRSPGGAPPSENPAGPSTSSMSSIPGGGVAPVDAGAGLVPSSR